LRSAAETLLIANVVTSRFHLVTRGWPTLTSFVKVGTHADGVAVLILASPTAPMVATAGDEMQLIGAVIAPRMVGHSATLRMPAKKSCERRARRPHLYKKRKGGPARHKPDDGKPLLKRYWRIFKDGASTSTTN